MTEEHPEPDDDGFGRAVYHRRMLGESNTQIAERYGVTSRLVATVFRRYCTYLQTERPSDDEARNLELDRLDMVQRSVLTGVEMGDPRSASIMLKAIQMRSELLGLNKLDARNVDTLNQILVVGEDKRAFIEALAAGRAQITGVDDARDTVLEGQVEQGDPL